MANMSGGGIQKWKNMISSNIIVPVAFDRQTDEPEISTPLVINLKSFNGLAIKSSTSHSEYEIRATLYDLTFKQYFGRTWKSNTLRLRSTSSKLICDQNVYFHTSIIDPSIVVVIELVNIADDVQTSVGWTLFYSFKIQELSDLSDNDTPKIKTLNIYNGTPRALLFLEEPILESDKLIMVNDLTLSCTFQSHKGMSNVMHLIPENCLVGANDCIPGLVEGHRTSSKGANDNLRKPRLSKCVDCSVSRVEISMTPDGETFDSELCRLVNAEKLRQSNAASALSTNATDTSQCRYEIIKRYLQIGVHNGWTYVAVPEVVQLTAEDSAAGDMSMSSRSGGSFRRRASMSAKRSSIRSSSLTNKLSNKKMIHRTKTHCEGVLEDIGFSIVFQIVYELSDTSTVSSNNMSRSSFSVAIRWSAFSPMSTLSEGKQRVLEMKGGAIPNADQQLTFTQGVGEYSSSNANLSAIGGGNISFTFNHSIPYKDNDKSKHFGDIVMSTPRLMSESNRTTPQSNENQGNQYYLPNEGETNNYNQLQVFNPYEQSAFDTNQTRQQRQQNREMMPPSIQYPAQQQQQQQHQHYQQQQQQQHYMPIAIQHISDSDSICQTKPPTSGEIVELPFTPQHIPILPSIQGLHSGIGLPRSSYAALFSAGFPVILDGNKEPPEVLDPIDPDIPFDINLEQNDNLAANEIILQFLAFSTIKSSEKKPSNIFFSFQFYRFPSVTSERLLLGRVQQELTSGQGHPCILQRLSKDGSILQSPPGYQVKYDVDPSFLLPGEGRLFLQHLRQQILHIDIWDGDSLMLIGSSTVELKRLCRQGQSAVQLTYELDVLYNDYTSPEETDQPMTSKLRGRLHLRMANIGHASEGKFNSGSVAVKPKLVIESDVLNNKFSGGTLRDEITALKNTLSIKPVRYLADTSYELSSLLKVKKEKKFQTEFMNNDDYQRKQNRINKVRSLLSNPEEIHILEGFRKEKETRLRDLRTIDIFRAQNKNNCIMSMLSLAITTHHVIHASMGSSQFFEFILRNPYNSEHTINIEIDDPDLKVITDSREWRHFKNINELYTSVEERMFNKNADGVQQLFLKPKECVKIPFKFLTMRSDQTVSDYIPSNPHKQKGRQDTVPKKKNNSISRIIKVLFRTDQSDYPPSHDAHSQPIAVLALRVESHPHRTDQSFRFYAGEQSFLKRSIRLMQSHHPPGLPSTISDPSELNQVFVRCSEQNVIVTTRTLEPGQPHDINIKCSCGASPQTKRFFVCIYSDPYFSIPIQIWQFYVHSLQKIDISTIEGQTSRANLVLRGTQVSRLVQCYSSNNEELEIFPNKSLVLGANTIQEMQIAIRMKKSGNKQLFVNVVDVESHELLRTWMISVTCKPPQISRVFEIIVPAEGGRGSNKKVSYMNPYPKRKTFTIMSSNEDVLTIRESHLDLNSGQCGMIAMRFSPQSNKDRKEIFVYINDDQDKTEETFCVHVTYK